MLDPRAGKLTIPISTAVEALQSNEVYLPRNRLRLDLVLSARQINAIRCAETKNSQPLSTRGVDAVLADIESGHPGMARRIAGMGEDFQFREILDLLQACQR